MIVERPEGRVGVAQRDAVQVVPDDRAGGAFGHEAVEDPCQFRDSQGRRIHVKDGDALSLEDHAVPAPVLGCRAGAAGSALTAGSAAVSAVSAASPVSAVSRGLPGFCLGGILFCCRFLADAEH